MFDMKQIQKMQKELQDRMAQHQACAGGPVNGARGLGQGKGDDAVPQPAADRAGARRAFELAGDGGEAEGGMVRRAIGAVDVAAGKPGAVHGRRVLSHAGHHRVHG